MTKSGTRSEFKGMQLILTKRKRVLICSKDDTNQVLIWTNGEGKLRTELINKKVM